MENAGARSRVGEMVVRWQGQAEGRVGARQHAMGEVLSCGKLGAKKCHDWIYILETSL